MSDRDNSVNASNQGADAAAQTPEEKANELSVKQHKAMAAMAAGKSLSRAAFEADVNPRTLLRWRKENPEFRAAMKRWKAETQRDARTILADDLTATARIVLEAVQAGDGYLGMQLLRAAGVFAQVAQLAKKAAPPASGNQP
jgi:hypothetical protein